MVGVLNGFTDHVELYWNAVGAGWDVPVERVGVRVEAPGAIDGVRCFAGALRSTAPCARSSSDGDVATFDHGRLDAFEALTVVVAFPPSSVAGLKPVLDQRQSLARASP